MRALLLFGLLATSAGSQPTAGTPVSLGAGVGVADLGTGAEKFAFAGTLVVHRPGLSVGVHAASAEALDIFRSPRRNDRTGAVLVGRTAATGPWVATALVGPSLTRRVLHGDRVLEGGPGCPPFGCGDDYERVERWGVGVMGRALLATYPVPGLPVGGHVEVGVNASTAGVTTSLVPGVSLRLGAR